MCTQGLQLTDACMQGRRDSLLRPGHHPAAPCTRARRPLRPAAAAPVLIRLKVAMAAQRRAQDEAGPAARDVVSHVATGVAAGAPLTSSHSVPSEWRQIWMSSWGIAQPISFWSNAPSPSSWSLPSSVQIHNHAAVCTFDGHCLQLRRTVPAKAAASAALRLRMPAPHMMVCTVVQHAARTPLVPAGIFKCAPWVICERRCLTRKKAASEIHEHQNLALFVVELMMCVCIRSADV